MNADDRYDAVVVGSGPNGLAAAVVLASGGQRVLVMERNGSMGGGTRTEALTRPGFLHDVCSAVHPLGIASPFFRRLPLAQHGLRFLRSKNELAHPLDDGPPGVVTGDLAETAASFGEDADRYRRLLDPIVTRFRSIAEQALGPAWRLRHPLAAIPFGVRAVRSAVGIADGFSTDRARATIGGVGAHALQPLDRPFTGAFVSLFGAAAHVDGWPVAGGGSGAIADALASHLRSLGGDVRTDAEVRSVEDLPPVATVVLDVGPKQILELAGERLPWWYRTLLERARYGPGVFKVDLALDGPVPWRDAACRDAATVHVGGSLEEIDAAERAVAEGRIPERPFVLVSQPSIVDDRRAPEGQHVLWAYCHVPNGSSVDMAGAIVSQIERFAPGVSDRILAMHTMGPLAYENYNPNLVGGDIGTGSTEGSQMFLRPVPDATPYDLPIPGWFVCSAATPPGPGVHGMCGFHAGRAALRWARSRRSAVAGSGVRV